MQFDSDAETLKIVVSMSSMNVAALKKKRHMQVTWGTAHVEPTTMEPIAGKHFWVV